MNVDANRVPSTERGFDEEAARPRHGVDHGPTVKRPCGQVDSKASQHGVKADRFEERPLTSPPLTVGKGRFPVAHHPATGHRCCWTVGNERKNMVWRFKVNRAAHVVKQTPEATGEVGQTPSRQFAALLPSPYGNRTRDGVIVKVGLHFVQPPFSRALFCGRHVPIDEETLQSTGDGQRFLLPFFLATHNPNPPFRCFHVKGSIGKQRGQFSERESRVPTAQAR